MTMAATVMGFTNQFEEPIIPKATIRISQVMMIVEVGKENETKRILHLVYRKNGRTMCIAPIPGLSSTPKRACGVITISSRV